MDDGIESIEISGVGVAHILANMRHLGDLAALGKRAARVEIAVEADDLMACLDQHRHHHGADVTQVPGDQHTHDYSSFVARDRRVEQPYPPSG